MTTEATIQRIEDYLVGRGVAYRCTKEGAAVTVVDRAEIPLERVRLRRPRSFALIRSSFAD